MDEPIGAERSTTSWRYVELEGYFGIIFLESTTMLFALPFEPQSEVQRWRNWHPAKTILKNHFKYNITAIANSVVVFGHLVKRRCWGAVQLPVIDNVNTTQLWWRLGLRGLANCHVSYRPSEHDTRTPTHIPHCHTLKFQEFIVKLGALFPLWILIRFSFMPAFAHCTLIYTAIVSWTGSRDIMWINTESEANNL